MAKKLYQSAAKVRTAVAELIYILPFNCTDVAPKCDEDIVTEAAEPNPLPVVTSRHPPLLRNPSWLYKRHGLGNYCCCSRTAWWPPQQSAGPLIHPLARVDRMNKTSTNMHFATIWPRIPFFTPPSKPPIVQTRNSLLEIHCCLCEP